MIQQSYQLLTKISQSLVDQVTVDYFRDLYFHIDWKEPVIGIMGERGVGKSTILLQHAKQNPGGIYLSADNSIVLSEGLFELMYRIQENTSIRTFYIDEIFTYPQWTQTLKNIIDSMPQIRIYFSGSSSIHLFDGMNNLARRIRPYTLYTLSFREYCKIVHSVTLPQLSCEQVFTDHIAMINTYAPLIKETYRTHYLRQGYYPYGLHLSESSFDERIRLTLEKIITEDLPSIANFQTVSLDKCKKLFFYLANNLPSELSVLSLAQKIGIDKTLLDNILYYLSQIGIIHLVSKSNDLTTKIRKTYKIFLGNPSIYHAYTLHPALGTIRESFAINALSKIPNHSIALPSSGDILFDVNETHSIFEIGGKGKTSRQVFNQSNAFILVDDMIGGEKKIPLWLLGLL